MGLIGVGLVVTPIIRTMYILEHAMRRTQIYFEEQFFESIKKKASSMNLSVSAYIRDAMRRDMEVQNKKQQPIDLSDFSGLWQDYRISIDSIREKAWK